MKNLTFSLCDVLHCTNKNWNKNLQIGGQPNMQLQSQYQTIATNVFYVVAVVKQVAYPYKSLIDDRKKAFLFDTVFREAR